MLTVGIKRLKLLPLSNGIFRGEERNISRTSRPQNQYVAIFLSKAKFNFARSTLNVKCYADSIGHYLLEKDFIFCIKYLEQICGRQVDDAGLMYPAS